MDDGQYSELESGVSLVKDEESKKMVNLNYFIVNTNKQTKSTMSLPSYILRIAYPIKNSNIMPCSKKYCLCVEYLNFGKLDHVTLYKHCMITNYLNDTKPAPRVLRKNSKGLRHGLP